MTETEHDRWSENVAPYALGALEPGKAAELERHVEGCERCRSELRWLEPAVRSLPESVQRLAPPRELRERVMAEVRADARRSPTPPAAEGAHRHASGWVRRLHVGPLGWRPLAGIAAVALVLVAAAGYEIGSEGSAAGPTSRIVVGHAPGITATMIRKGDSGTLHLANVKQLPDGRVLEAWVRRRGEIEPVPALFAPNRHGRASTMIADMKGVDTVMVTSEPSGGSRAPTSAPIVTMPIPQ